MNVEELIQLYNNAWNAQDVDTISSMHHPDVVFHNHTADERAEGADAVREHIAAIFRNNPDLQFSTVSLRVGDDFAVCEWTASGSGRRSGSTSCVRNSSARSTQPIRSTPALRFRPSPG